MLMYVYINIVGYIGIVGQQDSCNDVMYCSVYSATVSFISHLIFIILSNLIALTHILIRYFSL